jgi:voltage-gated potassium channel Kch
MNDETKREFDRIRRNFRIVAAFALAILLVGAVFYHHVEHLSWLNAFYFCTITLATVGYGDIVPHTGAGKVFTIFYVLVGIGILATFANLLVKNAVARRELKQYNKQTSKKRDPS